MKKNKKTQLIYSSEWLCWMVLLISAASACREKNSYMCLDALCIHVFVGVSMSVRLRITGSGSDHHKQQYGVVWRRGVPTP